MNRQLAAHLAAHHGLVRTADAVPDLVSRDELLGMVERGELIRIQRGLYRHAAVPVSLEQRIRAAMIAAGPLEVLSHRSAAARHGVRNFRCDLVEITHRSRRLPRLTNVVLHCSERMSAVDVVLVDGVRTTSPARTLVDIAAILPIQLAARYAQEWLSNRTCLQADLSDAIAHAGNHVGAHRLRRGLGDVISDADSGAEAQLGSILIRAGIPPQHHVDVITSAGDHFEIDWAYPDERIGLELDGYGVHLRSRAIYEHDRERRNELEIDGWRILNFTDAQCRRPAHVVDQVRRMLSASAVISR